MKLYSENENYKLYQGSMLNMLEVIDKESIDCVITDPPYELNFMGKGWDNAGVSFQADTWQKCYEVLKPGGYLLAFGGSRTFHRIACAIEDAGFEIRDTIMWLYGAGFPKSMDISKQIDKRPNGGYTNLIKFGNFIKKARENKKMTKKELGKLLFDFNSNREDVPIQSWEIGKEIPKKEVYKKLKEILELNDDMDFIFEEAEREVIGKSSYSIPSKIYDIANGSGERLEQNITAPSTDLAKQWQGWGTCLKPSFEPIIIARKPFKGSLVDNVIENGVGGLNIDECRVLTNDNLNGGAYSNNTEFLQNDVYGKYKKMKPEEYEQPTGRFPANTILTYDETDFEEVCGGFPYTRTGSRKAQPQKPENWNAVGIKFKMTYACEGSEGSASRYFYCAKASKKDRDEGCDTLNDGLLRRMRPDKDDSNPTGLNKEGRFAPVVRKNIHPTVKPTELMQYLVRLVAPKGATILDPFMGSGSTGKAVMFENKERDKNYKFIGIELTEEYLPIAKARIDYVNEVNNE